MNTYQSDDLRSKRSNAEENYSKAKEFVQNKEKELMELKDRLIRACPELDSDAYVSLMKQISEKESELTALKEIANRTADMIASNLYS